MKIATTARVAILILTTVMLSGCLLVPVPVDHGHRDGGYHGKERGGHRGDHHDGRGGYP